MSKVDAQRAMREAKYAALTAAQAGAPRARVVAEPARREPPRRPAEAKIEAKIEAKTEAEIETEATPQVSGLCGHRNIGNRSCSRPAGHAEKSHRYA